MCLLAAHVCHLNFALKIGLNRPRWLKSVNIVLNEHDVLP